MVPRNQLVSLRKRGGGGGLQYFGLSSVSSFEILLKLKNKFLHLSTLEKAVLTLCIVYAMHRGAHCIGGIISALGVSSFVWRILSVHWGCSITILISPQCTADILQCTEHFQCTQDILQCSEHPQCTHDTPTQIMISLLCTDESLPNAMHNPP